MLIFINFRPFNKKLDHTVSKGKQAQRHIEAYLQQQGLSTLNQNYYCRFGEIDLIMQDHQTIVFIEVRSRASVNHGHPLESISQKKQQKIIKTAHVFLAHYPQFSTHYLRFDCVSLLAHQHINWIKNAFNCPSSPF